MYWDKVGFCGQVISSLKIQIAILSFIKNIVIKNDFKFWNTIAYRDGKPTYCYSTIYIFHIFLNRKCNYSHCHLLMQLKATYKFSLILMASSIFNEQLFRHFTCFVKPYLKTFNSILYVRQKYTNIIKDRTVFLKHLKFINLLVVYIWFLARMWSWRVALILENQLHNTLQYVQMCTLKNSAKV